MDESESRNSEGEQSPLDEVRIVTIKRTRRLKSISVLERKDELPLRMK
jgi:hypothetical protein